MKFEDKKAKFGIQKSKNEPVLVFAIFANVYLRKRNKKSCLLENIGMPM
jgi:hypothetical protein